MDLQKADINDYALPLMRLEALNKQIYDLCLDSKFEEARLMAQAVCVEGRLLQHTLRLMNEKESKHENSPSLQDR